MSTRCSFLLLHGAILMSLSPTSASFIPGEFNNCSEASCTTHQAMESCDEKSKVCRCPANDSQACGTLNQQVFVNITGAANESSSHWSCCFCSGNASYCCNQCSKMTVQPTRYETAETLPSLGTDLTPLIYAGVSIVGLVSLCVLWKFIKHSWLLYRKKFTPINSDRVDHKKALQRQQIMEAMEENNHSPQEKKSAFVITSDSLTRVDNKGMTQRNNWSSARSLAPAYKPTQLLNQRTPPKLILDDEESDIERQSIDSASVLQIADDENLSDILNSDDELVLRPSSGSRRFQGIGNEGFIDEEFAKLVAEKSDKTYSSKMGKTSTTSKPANGSVRRTSLFVDNNVHGEERKASLASSDLSVDVEKKTVFLSMKNERKTKKEDSARQKKGKILLSPSIPEKKIRRSSVTSLDEDDITSKQLNCAKNNSLTIQSAQDGARRKSISTTDDEIMIVTPRDLYMKGRRNTKGFPFQNGTKPDNEYAENFHENANVRNGRLSAPDNGRRKSMVDNKEHVQSSGKNGTKEKESLRVSATQSHRRRKSLIVDTEEVKSSYRKGVKTNERLTTPAGERRESSIPDEEARSFDENETKTNANSKRGGKRTPLAVDDEDVEESGKRLPTEMDEQANKFANESGKSKEVQNTRRKKKKPKKEKEAKGKGGDFDAFSDLEEVISLPSQDLAHLNGIQPAPEGNSITLEDKETRRKKKKQKQKEAATRKPDDSGISDEDVENKIKEINANSLDPEVGRRKKKKQKNAAASRKKSSNPAAMPSDDEINGDLRKGGKKKRKKSLILEDTEVKSSTSEVET